jgi:hypothetical protein
MNSSIIFSLTSAAALAVGVVIGFLFGVVQNAALARNRKKLNDKRSHVTPWGAVPGSMSRVAMLLVVLVAVQVCCPMLFSGDVQWLISAGVLLGYGWSFMKKLQQRAEESIQ